MGRRRAWQQIRNGGRGFRAALAMAAFFWILLGAGVGLSFSALALAQEPAGDLGGHAATGQTASDAAPAQSAPGGTADAQSAPGEPPLAAGAASGWQLNGHLEWLGGYAWGDPAGLEGRKDLVPGQLTLKQRIAVDVGGNVGDVLALDAHVDNAKSDNLQLASFTLAHGPWQARFGDFLWQSPNPYLGYSPSLRGVELQAHQGPWFGRAFVAQGQGIPASKTFTGGASSDQVVYSGLDGPYAPVRENGSLTASIRGAFWYALAAPRFDSDFHRVWVRFGRTPTASRPLQEFLEAYGLGFLGAGSSGETEGTLVEGTLRRISPGTYAALEYQGQGYLVLRRPPEAVLRTLIQAILNEYNRLHSLRGAEAKTYPFVEGSQLEAQFLGTLLSDYSFLRVARQPEGDGPEAGVLYPAPGDPGLFQPQPPPDPRLRQGWGFYDLGNQGIEPGSEQVEVQIQGLWRPAAQIAGFSWQIYYDAGMMRIQFPPPGQWDPAADRVRVQYRYRVTDNVYPLGVAVAHGSERVYLNGVLLKRDTDYTLDYEAGILVLLRDAGPQDVLRIDYEYFRGALGVAGYYQEDVLGCSLGWSPDAGHRLQLDVVRAAERPLPPAEAAKVPVMPGAHTVVGASGRWQAGGLSAQVDAAFSQNVFPFDDNQREHLPNVVQAVSAGTAPDGRPYVLFGHRSGLTVYAGPAEQEAAAGAGGGQWRLYTLAAGLAGNDVRALAQTETAWYIATNGGLTRVAKASSLPGASPFDQAVNWNRYYAADGLPSSQVTAVAADSATGRIWVGTPLGLAWAAESSLGTWHRLQAGLPSQEVSVLVADPLRGRVWAGTPQGLAVWQDGGSGPASILLPGRAVQSLAVPGPGAAPAVPAEPGGSGEIVATVLASGELWSVEEIRPAAGGPAEYQTRRLSPPPAPVLALAWLDSGGGTSLYAATTAGLYATVAGLPAGPGDWWLCVPSDQPMTALATAAFPYVPADQVWAGSQAGPGPDGQGDLPLWLYEPGNGAGSGSGPGPGSGAAGIVRFASSQTGVPLEDSGAYADLDPGTHTARGAAARLYLEQKLGPLGLWLQAESLQPGFTAIGRTERLDQRQWSAGGRLELADGKAQVSLEHGDKAVRRRDWSGAWEERPVRTVTDGVNADWQVGATGIRLGARASLNRLDRTGSPDFDEVGSTVGTSVSASWWENRLRWSLGYDAGQLGLGWQGPWTWQGQTWDARISAALLPGLTADAHYRRPFQIRWVQAQAAESQPADVGWDAAWQGNESLDWGLAWNSAGSGQNGKGLGPVRTQASYRQRTNVLLGATPAQPSRRQLVQEANLGLAAPGLSLGNLRLTPALNGRWLEMDLANGHPRSTWWAQASLQGGSQTILPSVALTWTRTHWPADAKLETEGRLSANLSVLLTPALTPGLDLSYHLRQVAHPEYGVQGSSEAYSGLRLTWLLSPAVQTTGLLTWQRQENPADQTAVSTYGLQTQVAFALGPSWSLQLDGELAQTAGMSGGRPDSSQKLKLGGGLAHQFSPVWSATAATSVVFGRKPPQAPYRTYVAEAMIQAGF
ncbi:MAG: hypothetical protein IMW99_02470 [Firmicutes bacterium]|nr:hypothetical protein [Bacillota bacterium]